MSVHPTALIDPQAQLDSTVSVGPYCVVSKGVVLGPHNQLKSHVVLQGPLKAGAYNTFFPFCVIGEDPQDRKYQGEDSQVIIGDHNTFRECVTVNRGTKGGGLITRIGSSNLLMAYVHVAHDCILEDHCVLANGVNLAGHVTIHDHAILGGMVAVTQFNRVGSYAYIAAGSMIRKDIFPYTSGKGTDFRLHGVNLVGLRRALFGDAVIQEIKTLYHLLVTRPNTFEEAKKLAEAMGREKPHVTKMLQFCQTTTNGFYRNNEEAPGVQPSPP